MSRRKTSTLFVIADDDPDDRMMIREALTEGRVGNELHEVIDGTDLLAYLRREGKYGNLGDTPCPALVLLDLNMPRMDGREALREMKSDPRLRAIPVVVLTTSQSEDDIAVSYDAGASSYVTKPVGFAALVDLMQVIGKYWVDIAEVPAPGTGPIP